MSLNVQFYVTGRLNGKTFEQPLDFEALQTPTEVTYKIIKSPNPVQEYANWVLRSSYNKDEKVFNYVKGKYEIFNFGKDHVERFLKKVDEVKKAGLSIMPCMI